MPRHRVHVLPQYQILVLGDSAVGKTSLIARYIHNEFPCHSRSHIHSDGSSIYPTTINGHECVLTFFNISSSDNLTQLNICHSVPTVCLIVFSICDERSFEKIQSFQDSIHLISSTQSTSIPTILLANKTDCDEDRVVTKQSIEKLRSDFDSIIETSVKTNQGIQEVLQTAIKLLENHFLTSQKSNHSVECIII